MNMEKQALVFMQQDMKYHVLFQDNKSFFEEVFKIFKIGSNGICTVRYERYMRDFDEYVIIDVAGGKEIENGWMIRITTELVDVQRNKSIKPFVGSSVLDPGDPSDIFPELGQNVDTSIPV